TESSCGCAPHPQPPGGRVTAPDAPEWSDQLTLTVGSRGETVRHVQTFLCNYLPVVIDGHYGPRTQTAVQHVQFKLGIKPATGIVDERTWEALVTVGLTLQRDPDARRAPNGQEKDALFGPLRCEPLVPGQ